MNNEYKNVDFAFRVYGDNILECEQFISWLKIESVSGFNLQDVAGALDRPIYIFSHKLHKDKTYAFQLCPYYGGTGSSRHWVNDPLKGIYNEKPDVIVTKVKDDGTETAPLFAIELCDALQAGNQVWQRFRRAFNSARNKIPYLYVLPIIGWERASNGLSLKNPRYQSAQVCIAQLALMARFKIPSFQIYSDTPWADYAYSLGKKLPENYQSFVGVHAAAQYVSSYLVSASDGNEQNKLEELRIEASRQIVAGMIQVAGAYSNFSQTNLPVFSEHPALSSDNLDDVAIEYARALEGKSDLSVKYALDRVDLDDFVKHGTFFYKDAQAKTTHESFYEFLMRHFNWRDSMNKDEKIDYLKTWGIKVEKDVLLEDLNSLSKSHFDKIPVTYKKRKSEAAVINNRKVLRELLEKYYPEIEMSFLDWVYNGQPNLSPIVLIFLYGYKPSGDSRPDRGIIPAVWSLLPSLCEGGNIMVIMYSKYVPSNWKGLLGQKNNELWNVIGSLSGALIVDKYKSGVIFKND